MPEKDKGDQAHKSFDLWAFFIFPLVFLKTRYNKKNEKGEIKMKITKTITWERFIELVKDSIVLWIGNSLISDGYTYSPKSRELIITASEDDVDYHLTFYGAENEHIAVMEDGDASFVKVCTSEQSDNNLTVENGNYEYTVIKFLQPIAIK